MGRVTTIRRKPEGGRNYYLIDTCFLANKYIPIKVAPSPDEKERLRQCAAWWREITAQLKAGRARIYVPDVCIAEAFKVLAKKYYLDKWFKNSDEYKRARDKLSRDLRTHPKDLKATRRSILYHDISTSRDIIIAVDRFFEVLMKDDKNVQVADFILLATAKYLMDFYDIPRASLHIVTLDGDLRSGIKKVSELPNAYDPTRPTDACERIFV